MLPLLRLHGDPRRDSDNDDGETPGYSAEVVTQFFGDAD